MFDVAWRATPDQAEATRTSDFIRRYDLGDYPALVRRSVADPEWFWDAVVSFLEIPFRQPYSAVRSDIAGKEWTTWFTDGVINLSEACVDRWSTSLAGRPALIGEREDGTSKAIDFDQLAELIGRLAGGLTRLGVQKGDAVAVFLPMSPEAVAAYLAVARVGAIFIPVFSGYGPEAIASRLRDPHPKVMIIPDGFLRRGRMVESKEVADLAVAAAGGIDHVVVVRYADRPQVPWTAGRDRWWDDLLSEEPQAAAPTGAEDPVLLAYTSGTTGRPKGAVHVHGGFTVKLAQEGAFQTDFRVGDRVMWLTDMGWIMGPWIATAGLANGATVVTYDGAPDHPGPDRVWDLVEKHRLTFLGTSPTFVRSIQPGGSAVAQRHDLGSLRAFGSTGEPWNPDPWWWLFREVGGERIPIVNLSGGTEVGACILSVNLHQGIKPTSVGGPALGMAVAVLDPAGRGLGPGEGVGELAVEEAWPGMTRGFWNEPERYLDTYWRRFPGTWVHGDWASIDEDGFWFLHGRSDDTLNIAGKRIGPAELESVAVAMPEVTMAAAIGIPDAVKGEVAVIYVVVGAGADGATIPARVADKVASTLGKAFRPRAVLVVDDLPRTRSAKIMRRVVRALALGTDPGDLSALENPGSLTGITKL